MTDTARSTRTSGGRTGAAIALAVVVATAAAGIGNTVVSLIARAAGVSDDFPPLWPSAYLPSTLIGVLAGAVGWHIVRRRAGDPAAVLRWLVPTVVAVSLIPDIATGITGNQPATSWGGVAALMSMHLVVAAVAVPVYRRFLPLNA
ncbi:DUF6069 family protein [Streptomyces globisporus]|uniref:DUF6069 family protein n=1 Tax=Streptomyces TaxID=1883 RepID=UPI001F0C5A68|nr:MULTISPECIES: DUF6069 family protein [Streptomyces]